MTHCDEATCQRPAVKRGYCNAHYERLRRRGEFKELIDRRTDEERFWSRVEKTDTCWLWQAGQANGYGVWRNRPAHRRSYEQLVGPIPAGLHLDHLCRVRHCVNPDHLEPVTCGENLLRGETLTAMNAAKTHCPKGHTYSDENTYLYRGGRQCLTCRALTSAARAAKQKADRAARRLGTETVPCALCEQLFCRPTGDGRKTLCSDECRRRAAVQATQRYQRKGR